MKRSLTSENLLEGESGEERLSIQKMDEIVNYVVGLYPFRQKEIRNFLATFDQFLIEKVFFFLFSFFFFLSSFFFLFSSLLFLLFLPSPLSLSSPPHPK